MDVRVGARGVGQGDLELGFAVGIQDTVKDGDLLGLVRLERIQAGDDAARLAAGFHDDELYGLARGAGDLDRLGGVGDLGSLAVEVVAVGGGADVQDLDGQRVGRVGGEHRLGAAVAAVAEQLALEHGAVGEGDGDIRADQLGTRNGTLTAGPGLALDVGGVNIDAESEALTHVKVVECESSLEEAAVTERLGERIDKIVRRGDVTGGSGAGVGLQPLGGYVAGRPRRVKDDLRQDRIPQVDHDRLDVYLAGVLEHKGAIAEGAGTDVGSRVDRQGRRGHPLLGSFDDKVEGRGGRLTVLAPPQGVGAGRQRGVEWAHRGLAKGIAVGHIEKEVVAHHALVEDDPAEEVPGVGAGRVFGEGGSCLHTEEGGVAKRVVVIVKVDQVDGGEHRALGDGEGQVVIVARVALLGGDDGRRAFGEVDGSRVEAVAGEVEAGRGDAVDAVRRKPGIIRDKNLNALDGRVLNTVDKLERQRAVGDVHRGSEHEANTSAIVVKGVNVVELRRDHPFDLDVEHALVFRGDAVEDLGEEQVDDVVALGDRELPEHLRGGGGVVALRVEQGHGSRGGDTRVEVVGGHRDPVAAAGTEGTATGAHRHQVVAVAGVAEGAGVG